MRRATVVGRPGCTQVLGAGRTLDGGVRGDEDGGAGVGVGDPDDGGDGGEDARMDWTF